MPVTNNIAHHDGQINLNRQDVVQEILHAIETLKQGSGFGSIEIVLHEGRITQIEKREKFRFNHNATNGDLNK